MSTTIKRMISIAALTGAALTQLAVAQSVPTVNAGPITDRDDRDKVCDQTTVTGTYGFQGNGELGVGTPQETRAAETGTAIVDGLGNFSGYVTFSLGGQILVTSYTGTYQVNADCTISQTIVFGAQVRHQWGVIVNHGREIDFIDTDPGFVFTRVAKRVER